MTSNLNQENHARQFDYGSGSLCNQGEGYEIGGNVYEDDVRSSSGGVGSVVKTLQLFDIFPSSTALKSPLGMEAYVGFPFTSDQWKELERQTMIYKYMLASVPVPPELLFPISSNSPAVAPDPYASWAVNGGGIFNLRNSKNGDPEPGRCKRTDGKKWRCSKEVAPNQKYCERHLHRGRPRSRKPVEVKNNAPINTNIQAISAASNQILASNGTPLLYYPRTDLNNSPASYKESNRDLDLMIEAEMVAMCVANPQWQHLMYTDIANEGSVYNTNASVFHQDQDFVENQSMNVFSYTDYPAPDHAVHHSGNDRCYIGSFLNPGLASLEKHSHTETPRGFIDAWSYNNGNAVSSVSSDQGNFPSSSLTLTMAMAAGNILDEQMEKIETGSVGDYDNHKCEDSSWLGPVSLMPFAQGGPLAEALRPKSTTLKGLHSASPYYRISPPATTVSSPSGVLHRTLFSHSDGSGCNSPTLAAPTGLSEAVAFQLLN